MFVAGIDYSTHAVDLVLVDQDEQRPPWWHRFELHGQDAWERTRDVRRVMPGPSSQLWDEVGAFGVEDPRGQNSGVLYRVQGAVLACLPPTALVHPLVPSEWRKAVGLPGNATKAQIYGAFPQDPLWPQDACDAYCIALATATLIQKQAA